MNKEPTSHGSVNEFDANWSIRREAEYNHWIGGMPQNQIQLAFRSHWLLFQEMMRGRNYRTCLEVGCGRGSISSYFSDNGFECTLLDSSIHVLKKARAIFASNNHRANFVHGDALKLPFECSSFDVVVSIGLLEHFKDVRTPLKEQYRILKPGGLFLGYIVPEREDNLQRYFNWVNVALRWIYSSILKKTNSQDIKTKVYRSDYGSSRYLPFIEDLSVKDISVTGVYPLPMISYSPEFPFSLLPLMAERVLVTLFTCALFLRKHITGRHPWMCKEESGQAFLIAYTKED